MIECCRSCGYTISLIPSAQRPVIDLYADVQVQPRPQDTFSSASVPMFGSDSYIYSPLDYSQIRQIRILVLKAGTTIDPLRCELQIVNLQQGPVYEALSYTWADEKGDDSLCRTITCQDDGDGDSERLIAITSNCETALRHYRGSKEDRRIWVDSICIDQSNVMERNHQVKNMIAIFRNAVRVLVYLGDGDPELSRLLEYMTSDVGGQLPRTTDFISLFRCRWFHRVWVLQEVAVAKSILVRYGNYQLTWEDLLQQGKLFRHITAKKRIPLLLPPVVSFALAQSNTGTRHLHLQEKSDLLTLLHVSRNCSCKDPRDKVYAVMGMLKEGAHLALSADYSAPVTSGWVFLQAAAWHISRTESLDILSQIEGTSGITMPSWVPDWTRKSPSSLPAQYRVPEVSSFAPSILSCNGEVLVSSLRDEGRIDYPLDCCLSISGTKVGTVWMDHWIFDKALEDEYQRKHEGNTKNDSWTRYPPRWLRNPPPITRDWPAKLSIWARLLLFYPLAKNTAAEDVETGKVQVPACIPPAFGGPCENCLMLDNIFSIGGTYNQRAHLHWKGRNVCDDNEIENFLTRMFQYGTNRRIFATEHSLGLGPMDAKDRDEVWFLDGATVPFILRKVGDSSNGSLQYRLVGACYVHRLERDSDRCVNCSEDRARKPMLVSYADRSGELQREREQQWELRKRERILQLKLEQQRDLQLQLAVLKANDQRPEAEKERRDEPSRGKKHRELELRLAYENLNTIKERQLQELEKQSKQLEQSHKTLEQANYEREEELEQQLRQLRLSYKGPEKASESQQRKLEQEFHIQQINLEKAKEEQEVIREELYHRKIDLKKAKEHRLILEEDLYFQYRILEKTNEERAGELDGDQQFEYGNQKKAKEEQLREFEKRLEQLQQIHIV